ncbi:MAG: orotate phosphoribosyltransferase [Syntrophales bacterium]|jgi:orotate phosphoribosyltransferase|nr:orotate phosphoribosyltransferase [Syntrophales bacterium]MDY0045418.1 orotate phosphoribosyltransferase [Syntrophales bacterium]
MTEYAAMKKRLAEMIFEKSFRYSDNPPFTLASGKTSNYYFNCKATTLNPEGMYLIGNTIFDMLKNSEVSAVGGLTLGADPIANAVSLISYQKGRPLNTFIVRKDIKEHGTRSAIEGNVQSGDHVCVLDDVITTGGSTILAIKKAREAGLVVDGVIALIDRQEGGREHILESVSNVKSVFTRDDIMNRFRQGN